MIRRSTTRTNSRQGDPAPVAEALPGFRLDEPRKASILRFSPTAWAKLLFLRDLGESEVGGFGISAADDLLYVENIELVRQICNSVSVAFDDQSVAEFFDRQVDAGRRPEQFARIWAHSHPGTCPQPSTTDQQTFARVFGRTDWAVIFILARGGQSYARLSFHVGPGGSMRLPVEVDFSRPFPGSDQVAWQEQYLANVQVEPWPLVMPGARQQQPIAEGLDIPAGQGAWFDPWEEFLEQELAGVQPRSPEGFFDDNYF